MNKSLSIIPTAIALLLCIISCTSSTTDSGIWKRTDVPVGRAEICPFKNIYLRWMQFAVFTGMMRNRYGKNYLII